LASSVIEVDIRFTLNHSLLRCSGLFEHIANRSF
jgi:hypothetical protein